MRSFSVEEQLLLALLLVITRAQVKDIRALATSKGRKEQGAFLAEGDKLAREWLQSDSKIRYVIALDTWLQQAESLLWTHKEATVLSVSQDDLERISTQQTPNNALVVAEIPVPYEPLPTSEWCLVLDTIQDPGNMGTIIRIADWFGVEHAIASPDSVDYYNPKVVAAAMGGHLRVKLHTADLTSFLQRFEQPIIAATLGGQSLSSLGRFETAALIIGNESKGVSKTLLDLATLEITIPRRGGAESLNAAVSAGILLATIGPSF